MQVSTEGTQKPSNIGYMKTSISDRIRSCREALNLTQAHVAKAIGVSRVSVTKWESGQTKPDGENLHLLAKILSKSPEWILYGKEAAKRTDNLQLSPITSASLVKLPVLTWEQAGNWNMSTPAAEIQGIQKWVETMTKTDDNAFMLEVRGDSMVNPNGSPSIPDGSSVLIVPCSEDITELAGKIVLIQLEGAKDVTLKKVAIDGPNVYLLSLNPLYRSIELTGKYQVKGRVSQIHQYVE